MATSAAAKCYKRCVDCDEVGTLACGAVTGRSETIRGVSARQRGTKQAATRMGTPAEMREARSPERPPNPGIQVPGAHSAATPPCAICRRRGRGISTPRFLTHGVFVWLCATHGNDAFVFRRGGHEFADRLRAVWAAIGALGTRRRMALATHVHRLRSSLAGSGKPGSHSWPRLRREAEARFAAGEAPAIVIAELRSLHGEGPARPPSVRTMRRWFGQARWLARPAVPQQGSTVSPASHRPAPTTPPDGLPREGRRRRQRPRE